MTSKEELLKLKEKILKLKKLNEVENIMPKMSAYEFLKECNKERENLVAINYLGRTFTYKELFTKIDITARAYNELGVKKGDFVSMAMLMTPEAIVSFYALNKIGAIVHMINITHDLEEVKNDLNKTDSKVFILNDVFYTNAGTGEFTVGPDVN